ncbi:KCNB2 [Symbiodinium sp. CCMP2592]|nr:KCNB2 [Symbiodinium sp. CCMP2592]
MEPFSRQLDVLFQNVREDILKQHEHHMTVQRLRMRSLMGKSTEFFRLDRPPDTLTTLRTPSIRRMQTWGSERSSSSIRSRSKEKLQRSAPRPPSENKLKVTAPHPLPGGVPAEVDEVESVAGMELLPDGLPAPLVAQQEGNFVTKDAYSNAFAKPDDPVSGAEETVADRREQPPNDEFGSPTSVSGYVVASASIPTIPCMSDADDTDKTDKMASGKKLSFNVHEEERRSSNASKRSKISFDSNGSLPSFFKAQTAGTSQWKIFLQDSESSASAGIFARVWNFFILTTVFLSLTQALNPPPISGERLGYVEVVIEALFCMELVANAVLEPRKFVLLRDPHTYIDIAAVLPMVLRIEAGFVLPPMSDRPFSHYVLVGVVPTVRLLKLVRRFGKLSLVSHVLSTTGDALKLLLFLISVIVLSFSTLMYIVEPSDIIDSLSTAMWVCTVTVTTVGYGDVTPSTTAGRMLAGVLCFLSVLFMAMPISVLGNAMTHAWADRSRILLMTRTRQRLKSYGYEASDMPSLFRKFDSNGNGELTMDEFCDMVSKMNVGIRPSEAEELFELFDTDASGGIDDREFMKALFPDDYRKLYIRTTTMASF